MTTLLPEFAIRQTNRAELLGQRPCCIWFTGLSGAGKSTIAGRAEQDMHAQGLLTYILDGDVLRMGLNEGLGFTREDRAENIRRVGEVARLMVDAGLIVLVSTISPYAADRQAVRDRFRPGEFIEVYVSTGIDVCRARDVKGLYRRAMEGRLPHLSGWSDPYEPPMAAEVTIDTATQTPEAAALAIIERYRWRGAGEAARAAPARARRHAPAARPGI